MGEPIEPARVFDLLAGLVARSLVVAERDHPETRYRLLETIREYAEERLAEHGETDVLRNRHAEHYVGLGGILSEEMSGPRQIDAGRRLAAEHENLIAARNFAIDTGNVDVALRLIRNIPVATLQVGYVLTFSVDPILELRGVSDHPLYPFALAVDAVQAAAHGDRVAAEEFCSQALDAVDRFGPDPEQIVAQVVSNARANLAFSRGALQDAATYMERSVEIGRSCGRPASVVMSLGSAATFYVMAGNSPAAVPLAREGLALARQLGMPTAVALCLTALAGALADADPEQARALLRESLQLEASLDYETWSEITQAALISARLEEWDQALDLASRAIRHLHWGGERPLLGAMSNIVARVLAPVTAEAAAVIQGAAYVLATQSPTAAAPVPAGQPRAAGGPRTGTASFVTDLRRETTGLLRDRLGEQRLRELRAQGGLMNTDEAVAYVLDAVADYQRAAD